MNRYFKIFSGFLWFIVLFLVSCSNQKNTPTTRAYHNLTAHYNVLFNGSESFRKGLKRIDATFKDDYSKILPVFTYEDDAIAKSISPEMTVAINKGGKLIFLHSIKAKPKMKKGHLTPKEKAFYDKNEYNKWVDVAYMMMAKANFYKHFYKPSAEILNFVEREFEKMPAQYEAMIWRARISTEYKDYGDASRILTLLESEKEFPENLKFDLYITKADVALKQNQYDAAITPLKKALQLVRSRNLKLRYSYILAQVYQKTGDFKNASALYKYIIKKNPPYEMSFNARINLAATIDYSEKNIAYIKAQLKKMLRDKKNTDFEDQIYFAMGNMEMKENNEAMAIVYYRKSVSVSKTNINQKGLSCLTLADLYYAKKNYIPSQAYYDTALHCINEKYPDYKSIKSRADCLVHLVLNLNTIALQDSLQHLASLSEDERLRIIDGIISDLKKKEAEEQLAESLRLQEYYNSQNSNNGNPDQNAQAKWYFYNPVSIAQGVKDFQLRWGKRQLEDDWRRKNKGFVDVAADTSNTEAEGGNQATDKKKVEDNKTRNYYTQNIPVNDSMMQASTKKIIDAYFNAGLVYRNELNDNTQGVLIYEKMLDRFPDCTYKLAVYYQQYIMYTDLNNGEKAAYYKNLLLTKYPDCVFSRILTDPEYYKQIMENDHSCDNYYELTYNLYNSGNYSKVIENADSAFIKFKNNPILPKFAFLKTLAIGKSADIMTFREELNKLAAQYPKDDVGTRAKDIITYLDNYKPETKQKEDIKIAEATFTVTDKSTYYFALVVEKNEDINQIAFDVINFNLDNFTNDHLEVTNEVQGKKYKIILVKSFPDQSKGLTYYNTFISTPAVLTNVKSQNRTMFIISPDNMELLRKQDASDGYYEFFTRHILKSADDSVDSAAISNHK